MAKVSLTANTWTAIVTTTVDTAIQNKSGKSISLLTGTTTGLGPDSGLELQDLEVVVFGAGLSISGYSSNSSGSVSVTELGT